MADSNLKAIGDNSNPQNASRKVQITDLSTNQSRKIYLTIIGAKNHPNIKLPLTRKSVPTKLGDEPDEWPLVLVPFRLKAKGLKASDVKQFKPEHSSSVEYHIEPSKLSDGYLYVFVNGYLWRELAVEQHESGDTYYYDIDLLAESKKPAGGDGYTYTIYDVNKKADTDYRYKCDNRDVRLKVGKRDNRLVLPFVKAGSSVAKVQICYSRIQWSWLWIETMGGISPQGKPRDDWFLDDVSSENIKGKERRAKRCYTVPLVDYKAGLDKVGDIGPVSMSNTFSYNIDYEKNIPFLELDDPIGIALKLKADHLHALNDFQTHTEVMGEREYPLAVIVNQIVKSEEKANADGVKKNPKFEVKTRFKDRVNQPKIDRAIEYWKKSNAEKEKAVVDVGKIVIWWMEDQNCTQYGVHLAFIEMLKNNNPLRFCTSVSIWADLMSDSDFDEAHAYLKKIIDSKDGIIGEVGKLISNPTKEQLNFMQRLETGDLPKNDRTWVNTFGTQELIAIADYGNKIIRDTVKALTMSSLKNGGDKGLKFVAKMVERYLPQVQAVVPEGPAFARYHVIRKVSPDVYSSKAAASNEFKKTKIKYLKLKGANNTTAIGMATKDSKTFKLVVGVRVVIEIINVAYFWGVITEKWKTNKKVTAGDWVSLTESVVGAIEGIAGLAKDMMDDDKKRRKTRMERSERIYNNRKKFKAITDAHRKDKITKLARSLNTRNLARTHYNNFYKRVRNLFSGINTFTSHVSAITKAAHGLFNAGIANDTGNNMQALGGITESAGGLAVSVGVHSLWRLGAAAVTRTALGAAVGLGGPVAIILIVLGLIAYFIGGWIYRKFAETDLEKAINYCYFGKYPYYPWKLPDGYHHAMLGTPTKRLRRRHSKGSPSRSGGGYSVIDEFVSVDTFKIKHTGRQRNGSRRRNNVYKAGDNQIIRTSFFTEIQYIYRCLFQYNVDLQVRRIFSEYAMPKGVVNTGWIAVTADIKFGRMLTEKSTFFTSFELKIKNSSIKLNKKDLFIREKRNSEGVLTGLSYTYLIEDRADGFPYLWIARLICEVKMKSMLDIYGDGNYTVPVDLSVKKKGKSSKDTNEQSFYKINLFEKDLGDLKWIKQSSLKSDYNADLWMYYKAKKNALRLAHLTSSLDSICEYEKNNSHNANRYFLNMPFAMQLDPNLTCASAKNEIIALGGYSEQELKRVKGLLNKLNKES